MRAMVLERIGRPLVLRDLPEPVPGAGEIRIKISACGVCRTDLHVIDGELPNVRPPVIPGHEIVGRVEHLGPGVESFALGDRVGVPWLGRACGVCAYCDDARENLCDAPEFTGYTRPGGYATSVVADAAFVVPLDLEGDDVRLAPFLCAGLIGWRSLKMSGDGRVVGLYGFGAAAHLVLQMARFQARTIFVFTRPGDLKAQGHALRLGADWVGGSDEKPPAPLDAAILYAPVGALVPAALRSVRKGGRVVCAGIHMSDIPSFPYVDLWGERHILSVANLTRTDAAEFFSIARRAKVAADTTTYPLARANDALDDLRRGRLEGAAVLTMDGV